LILPGNGICVCATILEESYGNRFFFYEKRSNTKKVRKYKSLFLALRIQSALNQFFFRKFENNFAGAEDTFRKKFVIEKFSYSNVFRKILGSSNLLTHYESYIIII